MAGGNKKPASSLSQKLKDLQNQRDTGLISHQEYRTRAAAIVEDGHRDPERAALANHKNIQSLTGAVGVMVETHCKESWQQVLTKRWLEAKHKRVILAAMFVVLVVIIAAFSLMEEDTSVDAIMDPGAGVHEHHNDIEPLPTVMRPPAVQEEGVSDMLNQTEV
mmetsp:Transcript_18773/g.52287  ORF Transcript_18773/g.52287 Transcript_18773/m.52287 type:complete len:163 (+) Transcript_18773:118-606(+)